MKAIKYAEVEKERKQRQKLTINKQGTENRERQHQI